jgi:hypothetical protein
MWADTLQSLEREHVLRLIAWGGLSVLSGTALLLLLVPRRIKAPLAVHFAVQCVLWGAIVLAWGLIAYRHVPVRDYGSAYALARTLWFAIGAEIGGIAIGATLAVGGWAFGRRLSAAGAGFGVAVQSAALLVLDLIFLRGIHL